MYTHCLQLESGTKTNIFHLMYIEGCAYTHNNIAEFTNSSVERDPTVRANCEFVVFINYKDGDMEREVDRLIKFEAIVDLTIRDDLLINYPFTKNTPTERKREEQGLPKDVLMGRKPKNNECA